jgi:hypothetical protein
MQVAQSAACSKIYPMDHYDGGRAATEPEHFRRPDLHDAEHQRSEPSDDDVRAAALAIIALTTCSD